MATPTPILPSTRQGRSTERKASWAPSGTRNPVSLRLNKVLATNLDNDDMQETMWTLSDLYATSSGAGASGGGGSSAMSTTTAKSIAHADSQVRQQQDGGADVDVSHPAPPALLGVRTYGKQSQTLAEAVPGESAARARKDL